MRILSQRRYLPGVSLSAATVFALLIAASLVIALLPLTYAAVAVVGTITLILILIRVDYGIYLIIFSIPFGSLKEVTLGPASLTLTEALVPLVFFGWVLRLVAQREARVRFTPIFPFLALFLATLVFSATIAQSLPLSTKELLKWGEFSLLFLVVANVMTSRRQVAVVVMLLLLATSLEAFHGWYQFLFRQGPEGFLIGGRFLRAFGTFGQPNPYAGYLGLTLPLLLGLLIGSRWNLSMRIDRGFITVVAGSFVIFAALLMSFSRGALLGLTVAVAVILSIRSRKSLVLMLVGIVIVTTIALLGAFDVLPAQLAERLSSVTGYFGIFDVRRITVTPENWAIVERMAYWQSAWEMFRDHWLFGVGIGNFSVYYSEYAFPDWAAGALGHAHNYYLNVMAEAGLLGIISYLAFMLAVFVFALRTLVRLQETGPSSGRTSPEGWNWLSQPYPLALGIFGVLLELFIHNFFDVLYVHGMAVQLGLILGLLVALDPVLPSEGPEEGVQNRND